MKKEVVHVVLQMIKFLNEIILSLAIKHTPPGVVKFCRFYGKCCAQIVFLLWQAVESCLKIQSGNVCFWKLIRWLKFLPILKTV